MSLLSRVSISASPAITESALNVPMMNSEISTVPIIALSSCARFAVRLSAFTLSEPTTKAVIVLTFNVSAMVADVAFKLLIIADTAADNVSNVPFFAVIC